MKRLYGLLVLLCFMLTACNDDFLDVDPVDRFQMQLSGRMSH